jgi:hypothetical protein
MKKHRVVTFEENGVAKVSDYSDSKKTDKEIMVMMHESSYRHNLAKRLKEMTNGKSLDSMSDNSLGYELSLLIQNAKRVYSTIMNIEFHDKPLHHFGRKV